jgi:hypothetical protein
MHDLGGVPASGITGHRAEAGQGIGRHLAGDIAGSFARATRHGEQAGRPPQVRSSATAAARGIHPAASRREPARARPPLPRPSGGAGHRTMACHGSGGLLPANYAQIVSFLTAHGYRNLAAAGIAGNIYQESKGDPESVGSGGGGLIGWTPLPAGFVTGSPAADLRTQLAAILTYNQQWSQYIPALQAAASPAGAAYVYMTYFERPGIPAAASREAAAAAVAAACGF